MSNVAKVKKAYAQVIAFLEENGEKKVKTVINDVIALCAPKSGGSGGGNASTFVKDENGVVVAVRCFYHKLWMSPAVVEFGAKASSATGLNSMCKDGVSKWTKQQRDFKTAQAKLLQAVSANEVAPDQIAAKMAELEAARATIVPMEDGYGFETPEEAIADAAARAKAPKEATV